MDVKKFVLDNFLILGLLTVITFGLIYPDPGLFLNQQKVASLKLTDIAVDVVFVVSGLCLDSAKDALQWKALVLGMVLVLIVTPLLSQPILMLHTWMPSLNEKLLQGMALFTIVPTTLSSGVTMITQAKGNVSLAILLTSVTNIIGVFTMSFTATTVFTAGNVHIVPFDMLYELIFLTLVPLLLGMAIRRTVEPIRKFAVKNKKPLSLSQNSCILFVVWLMISKARESIFDASSVDLTLCLILAGSVHLIYRLLGYFAAEAARLPHREWITIVLMSSQKSLPVCVSVLATLPTEMAKDQGLFILPCVMAHAAQLIIDSILAKIWAVPDEIPANKVPLLY